MGGMTPQSSSAVSHPNPKPQRTALSKPRSPGLSPPAAAAEGPPPLPYLHRRGRLVWDKGKGGDETLCLMPCQSLLTPRDWPRIAWHRSIRHPPRDVQRHTNPRKASIRFRHVLSAVERGGIGSAALDGGSSGSSPGPRSCCSIVVVIPPARRNHNHNRSIDGRACERTYHRLVADRSGGKSNAAAPGQQAAPECWMMIPIRCTRRYDR